MYKTATLWGPGSLIELLLSQLELFTIYLNFAWLKLPFDRLIQEPNRQSSRYFWL